jgi:hypothetical protein
VRELPTHITVWRREAAVGEEEEEDVVEPMAELEEQLVSVA